MEHRGTARSHILPVVLDGAAPPRGSGIVSGGKPLGTLLSAAGPRALALIRLDRLQEAYTAGEVLTAGERGVRVIVPAWARYHVPQPRAA
jgi:hypothetical protein